MRWTLKLVVLSQVGCPFWCGWASSNPLSIQIGKKDRLSQTRENSPIDSLQTSSVPWALLGLQPAGLHCRFGPSSFHNHINQFLIHRLNTYYVLCVILEGSGSTVVNKAKPWPASPLLLVETHHEEYGQVIIRVRKIKQGNVCCTWVVRKGQSEGIKLEQKPDYTAGESHEALWGRQVQGSDHQALEAFIRSLGFIPNMLRHHWRALSQTYTEKDSNPARGVISKACISLLLPYHAASQEADH